MVLYRRNRLPGGTFFFTATLRDRILDLERMGNFKSFLLK